MSISGTLVIAVGEDISLLQRESAEYRILYVDKEELTVTIRQKCYHASAGQVLIIRPTDCSPQFSAAPGFKGLLLQVGDSASVELVRRYLLFMNVAWMDVNVFATGEQGRRIRSVFRNIAAEMHGESGIGETILHLLLQELMVRLHRADSQTQPRASSNRAEVVFSVCALLEKEYNKPLTLEQIAEQYNISVSYLSHIFKEMMGVSLMRYLLLTRIRMTQEYLTQTVLPINEIAEKCGFKDLSNFGRTFRKETGFTPRQYRQTHRKTE